MSDDVVDLSTDLHGHAVDYACDLDRAWFADHPGEDTYYREAVEHEWCRAAAGETGDCHLAFDMPPVPPGLTSTVMVEVTQVADGIRLRQPYLVIERNS